MKKTLSKKITFLTIICSLFSFSSCQKIDEKLLNDKENLFYNQFTLNEIKDIKKAYLKYKNSPFNDIIDVDIVEYYGTYEDNKSFFSFVCHSSISGPHSPFIYYELFMGPYEFTFFSGYDYLMYYQNNLYKINEAYYSDMFNDETLSSLARYLAKEE